MNVLFNTFAYIFQGRSSLYDYNRNCKNPLWSFGVHCDSYIIAASLPERHTYFRQLLKFRYVLMPLGAESGLAGCDYVGENPVHRLE